MISMTPMLILVIFLLFFSSTISHPLLLNNDNKKTLSNHLLSADHPHVLTECVDELICGPGRQLVGLEVEYYCRRCQPGFEGRFCERSSDQSSRWRGMAQLKINNSSGRIKNVFLSSSSAVATINGQFCVKVQTKCENGEPEVAAKEPICE